jgi:glycosyltransferase involved in cell wall biosynthesis
VYTISIVICTYNRASALARAIDAFGEQTYPHFELIVVNGPSNDGTAAVLERYRGRIKLAHCDECNVGRSRNAGIDIAAGEIVAFIDDDAVPSATWIEQLVKAYQNKPAAAAGGPVFDHHENKLWGICTSTLYGEVITNAEPPASSYLDKRGEPFIYLAGCNMSFRRSALLKLKGFNENLVYGYEDVDICKQLLDTGYHIEFVEDAKVYHTPAPNAIRDQNGVMRDPYSIARAQTIFALQDRFGSERDDFIAELYRRMAIYRQIADSYLAQGLFTPLEREGFVSRVDEAFADGIASGSKGRSMRTFSPVCMTPFSPFYVDLPASELQRIQSSG